MKNKFKKNIETKSKNKDIKSGGANNKTKIKKVILIWLLLILLALYNISIKVFKIAWIKGALSTKKDFRNKWFFNFKNRYYIIGCKDWLINFKKFSPDYPMDIITGEVIKINKIGSI